MSCIQSPRSKCRIIHSLLRTQAIDYYNNIMRQLIIVLLAVMSTANALFAQALDTGSLMPALKPFEVANYASGLLDLKDLKGKLIVLDFWNTGCYSCIQAFPKLDSLQNRFGDDIQIILVNKESRDSTQRFFAKRKKIRLPQLPFISGDTILSALFPYNAYPYAVWIDRDGTVRYRTAGYNTTAENISAVLKGDRLDVPLLAGKRPAYMPVVAKASPDWEQSFLYFSYITPCRTDVNILYDNAYLRNKGRSIRVSNNCASLAELFIQAYEEQGCYRFTPANMQVELPDSLHFFKPSDINQLDRWSRQYSYNYDLYLPVSRKDEMYKMMQEDLSRYFNFKVSIKIRKLRCYILVSKDNRNTDAWIRMAEDQPDHIQLTNMQTLSIMLEKRLTRSGMTPVLNETGFSIKRVLFTSETINSFSVERIRTELHKNGLDLKEAERELPVLVIERKGKE
ncbi:MAG TPA: TlpA disulfide reductase family protein [Flavisolibacter sp.]|nr:TlpA disulfide reductase family protein [Flavisolibacter sp.]